MSTFYTEPTTGTSIATDIVGSLRFQQFKLDIGGPGATVAATGTVANGLLVDVSRVQGNVVVAGKDSSGTVQTSFFVMPGGTIPSPLGLYNLQEVIALPYIFNGAGGSFGCPQTANNLVNGVLGGALPATATMIFDGTSFYPAMGTRFGGTFAQGPTASGSACACNPQLFAGADAGNILRTILTDNTGHLQVGVTSAVTDTDRTASGTIASSGVAVTIATPGCGTVIVAISTSANWNGTLLFQAQGGDGNYQSISGFNPNTGAIVTSFSSASTTAITQLNSAGATNIRVVPVAYVTGSATITLNASAASVGYPALTDSVGRFVAVGPVASGSPYTGAGLDLIGGADAGGIVRAILTNTDGSIPIGGFTSIVNTSLTRPANTTTYTANTAIANATSAASQLTFSNCARANGYSGIILGAQLFDFTDQATKLQSELWLFDTSLSVVTNDNSNWAPVSGDIQNLVGIIPFNASYIGNNSGTAGTGNVVFEAFNLNMPFKCGAGSRNLFGQLVARNAYVPVNMEMFIVRLQIIND